LGYPDQALKRSQEAIALARELNHPHSLACALHFAGTTFHMFRREVQTVKEQTEALALLSAEKGFVFYQAMGVFDQGWVQAHEGQIEEGIAQMRQSLTAYRAIGMEIGSTGFLGWLVEGYRKAGQAEEGLSVLSEALALVEETDERYYEAELHRLKGELMRMQGEARDEEVEACFRKALEVARVQEAKSWELRAAMSLSRLWQKQGKREEAHKLLADVYNWFTEGFDTPDLNEAKALLEELS
jgi:predicted ATPase